MKQNGIRKISHYKITVFTMGNQQPTKVYKKATCVVIVVTVAKHKKYPNSVLKWYNYFRCAIYSS